MRSSTTFISAITVLAAAQFAFNPTAHAQTVIYSQDFENMGNVPIGGWGPQGLINQGWTFRNQSAPLGPVAWVSGCCWDGLFQALSGTGYLAAYQDSAGGSPAQYNAWAILPAIPDQQAGDTLTIYTVSSDTYWWADAHLEVRYSPSGNISTGNTATSTGDFTQTLLAISPIPNYNQGVYNGWTKWTVTLPGPGRIALRQMGDDTLYFGVEDLSITRDALPAGPLPETFEDLENLCEEGPCRLTNVGWIFRDQGTWQAGPAWEGKWPLDPQTPHTGFSFLKSHKVNNPGGSNSGSISAWAILPALATAEPGDVLSFWVRGHLEGDGSFQVRYSPTGQTNTGATPTSIGSFTDVLFELDALSEEGWQHVLITLPPGIASGRLALRHFDAHQNFYDYATMVLIDSMAINPPPYPTPMPQPGQTISWGLAGSPYNINTDLYVPPTGTIVLEPGITVNLAAQCTLSVGGTVEGVGSGPNSIVIQSAANYPPGLHLQGTLDLTNASIKTQVHPDNDGSLILDQTSIVGPNGLIYNQWAPILDLDDTPPFISINNCQFINANLYPADATLRLTNTTFSNGSAWMNRGYWFLHNLSFSNPQGTASGAALSVGRDQQNVHLDHIHVEGANGPAISVTGDNIGNDYFFGPNLSLSGNLYPAQATGGIIKGSVLPASGNQNNAVLVNPGEVEIRGPVNWHDPGIPYFVSPENHLFLHGEVNMFEGVRFAFPPGIAIRQAFNFATRGLPEDPVRLEPLGGSAWWAAFTPWRMEYTVVEGSMDGVVNPAGGLPGYFDSCEFTANNRAMVGSCIINKSNFFNNGLGVVNGWIMNGATNPNSFVGNGLAVQGGGDARNNWWGHPTGPNASTNPGGQGDAVQGSVQVLPFRTSPPVPDAVNHPPVVRMQQVYFVVASGGKIIVHWDTMDEDVVSHRVLLSSGLDIPADYVVIGDGLPASQRSFAITAPGEFGSFFIRVEAIDSIGQVGWDRKESYVDNVSLMPEMVLPLPPGVPHFTLGHAVPIDPNISFFDEGWVLLDGQMVFESFGAAGVLPTVVTASNDAVRLCLVNAGGIRFSEYFMVRPDARLGDAAPTVSLLSPVGGSFAGGTIVPISWTSSDDESVRSVTIQASYDGGLTYHDIARRLPGTQTSYNWKLPPLDEAIANVRLRVSVEDLRFQMSSSTSAVINLITGKGGRPGDINADGVVNVTDMLAVIQSWGACPPQPQNCPADVAPQSLGDGVVNVSDLLLVIQNWG